MIHDTLNMLVTSAGLVEVRLKRRSPLSPVCMFDTKLVLNDDLSFTATEMIDCDMTDNTEYGMALSLNFFPEHVTSIIIDVVRPTIWLSTSSDDFPGEDNDD